FGPKRVELTLEGVEAPIHGVEAPIDHLEAPIDHLEPPIDRLEPPIDRVEALIDGRKALDEEPHEFCILGRGRARSVRQCAEGFTRAYSETVGVSPELDLDPRAAPDSSSESRQELGDPHLQTVLRAKGRTRPVDHPRIRDQPRRCGLRGALDAAAPVRRRHPRAGRVTQALYLAGVARGDHVETSAKGGEPDQRGHLGAVATERHQAHVAMAVEVAGGAHDGAMVPSGPRCSWNDGPRGQEERSWASWKARWPW